MANARESQVPVVQMSEIVKWTPPPSGVLNVNVDGALDKRKGKGGVGIAVRDEFGQLVMAVAIPLPNVWSAEVVEATGFRYALESIRDRSGEDFLVEGDALGVIQMLQGVKCANSSVAVVVMDVINLARLFHSISFSFVRRNFNRVAHVIAKYALSIELATTWNGDFPDWVCSQASLDVLH